MRQNENYPIQRLHRKHLRRVIMDWSEVLIAFVSLVIGLDLQAVPAWAKGAGTIRVTCDNPELCHEGQLFMDGNPVAHLKKEPVGTTVAIQPVILDGVETGKHTLTLKKHDVGVLKTPQYRLEFSDWEKVIQIKHGITTFVTISGVVRIGQTLSNAKTPFAKTEVFGGGPIAVTKRVYPWSFTETFSYIDTSGTVHKGKVEADFKYTHTTWSTPYISGHTCATIDDAPKECVFVQEMSIDFACPGGDKPKLEETRAGNLRLAFRFKKTPYACATSNIRYRAEVLVTRDDI